MGKNRDRESLIRLMTSTIVHEIVAKHTNRPESKEFLDSEIIEYRGQAEKAALNYNWNEEDKEYILKKVSERVKEKMISKYSDVLFEPKDAEDLLKKWIRIFA